MFFVALVNAFWGRRRGCILKRPDAIGNGKEQFNMERETSGKCDSEVTEFHN